VLDLLIEVTDGIELTNAIRILSNGEGSEIVWTLVKAQGVTDTVFHEHLRWVGSALHNLRKTPIDAPVAKAPTTEISDRSKRHHRRKFPPCRCPVRNYSSGI